MLKLTLSKEPTAVCHAATVGWEMAQTQKSGVFYEKKKKRGKKVAVFTYV